MFVRQKQTLCCNSFALWQLNHHNCYIWHDTVVQSIYKFQEGQDALSQTDCPTCRSMINFHLEEEEDEDDDEDREQLEVISLTSSGLW